MNIDGFNLLTTIEAAFAGGVLLRGRDECLRDMACPRKLSEGRGDNTSHPAIGQFLGESPPELCTWWLDRPVSNSGRVSQLIMAIAQAEGWPWQTQLVPDPDHELKQTRDVVVTADSVILDACNAWVNLASGIVGRLVPHAWIVPLDDSGNTPPAFTNPSRGRNGDGQVHVNSTCCSTRIHLAAETLIECFMNWDAVTPIDT